jgi:GTP-binding protein
MTATVVIVGRPNVGKSTLFNRLIGRKLALVDDQPGVTRDRREGDASLGGRRFALLDTAGLDRAKAGTLEDRMRGQTEAAIDDADLCLFVIDARQGVTPMDRHFAEIVRKKGKPVLLLANKCEGNKASFTLGDAWGLGLGEPIAISAEHGVGLGDLYDAMLPWLDPYDDEEVDAAASPETSDAQEAAIAGLDDEEAREAALEKLDEAERLSEKRPLRLAIVGRPNAGKSTLINTLLGEERMLTGPEAGITRDSISVDWNWQGQPVKLWDTAGLRRKSRVNEKLEKMSVTDALRAVRFAEVVVLMIDAASPFDKQDLQIADLIEQEGRGLVIALNKWDAVEDKQKLLKYLEEEVGYLLPQIKGVALVPLSGERGQGVDKLMKAVFDMYAKWNSRIRTQKLNRWLAAMLERHPPPAPGGRRLKIRYMTQARNRPPTFIGFCQRADDVPESYIRYLVKGLRDDFDLGGVPIRFNMRAGRNPFDKGDR